MHLSHDTDSIVHNNSYTENSYPRLHAKSSHAGVGANAMQACAVFACQCAIDSHASVRLSEMIRETGIKTIHHYDCANIISNNKNVVNYKNIVISTESRNRIVTKIIVALRGLIGIAQVCSLCLFSKLETYFFTAQVKDLRHRYYNSEFNSIINMINLKKKCL